METNVLTVDGDENFIYETGITISEILYNDSVYRPRVKYINMWCLCSMIRYGFPSMHAGK